MACSPMPVLSHCGSRHLVLCSGPEVVAENPSDSLATTDSTRLSLHNRTVNQLVGKSLVIPLAMVMRDKLSQSPTKVPFAERDDSI